MKKDFLTLQDVNAAELMTLIRRAIRFKKSKKRVLPLKGKTLGLIFEKSSTRTRVSFETAMVRLGGHPIYLEQKMMQLARGESYADTARVLSRYVDALVLRAYSQTDLEEMAAHASIPVINGLTDLYHPCQVMADLMTLAEKKGDLQKLKIAYVGDGNNMANTWIQAAMILKFQLRIASPKGYWPLDSLLSMAAGFKNILITEDPIQAVRGVDAVNTDTWFSMGQEVSDEKRNLFQDFQVNQNLMAHAAKKAVVLHCLPAHRGEEITDDVIDGPGSVVFDEAENRLYVQMALLEALLKRKKR